MILSFKKFDNLLLYLSLNVGVNFINSQHSRLKWYFKKLDKCWPRSLCGALAVVKSLVQTKISLDYYN